MAKVTIKDVISSKAKELNEVISKSTEEYRKELDSRIHILDLSYDALKVNMRGQYEVELYDRLYSTLQTVVRKALSGRTISSLNSDSAEVLINTLNKGPFLVDGDGFFIVGSSFGSVRNFVTNKISKSKELINTRFGMDSVTKIKQEKNYLGKITEKEVIEKRSSLDIGHISTENNPNLQSPLESKLQNIYEEANTVPGVIGNKIKDRVSVALNRLYSIQARYSYSFKNTTPEAIATARSKLGEAYIVVTIQTASKNNAFSRIENRLMARLKRDIVTILSKAPTTFSGSNTIAEDLVLGIASKYDKKLLSKIKPHAEQKGTVVGKKVNINVKNVKGSSVSLSTKSPTVALRNIKGHFSSPSTLQAIINSRLIETIKRNMGDGSRRDILNLRTGRFAESVAVRNVTVSREGMITAFYNYMKYPYATFSEGGRQQIPRSRDPKLLISKSIREIVSQNMANKLRAVAL